MKNKKILFLKVLLCSTSCAFANLMYAADTQKTEAKTTKANTTITSDRVEMDSKDNTNIFNFYGNVHLEGEGLVADCDKLEVIAKKTESESSTLGNVDSFEKITAIGNVHMIQEGRDVKAGHAVIFAEEGKIVLTENPEVTDSQGIVKGHRIIFYKNDGKAYVEGAPGGERPKIILPTIPDQKKATPPSPPQIETQELPKKK